MLEICDTVVLKFFLVAFFFPLRFWPLLKSLSRCLFHLLFSWLLVSSKFTSSSLSSVDSCFQHTVLPFCTFVFSTWPSAELLFFHTISICMFSNSSWRWGNTDCFSASCFEEFYTLLSSYFTGRYFELFSHIALICMEFFLWGLLLNR